MDIDSRALKALNDWNSREYKSEGQKTASLQVLIISALKEQDKLTRYLCAERIAFTGYNSEHDVVLGNAIRKCMNAKALPSKPEPTPFTHETWPKQAVLVRKRGQGVELLVTARNESRGMVLFFGGWTSYTTLFGHFDMSLDHGATWQPCHHTPEQI